MGYLAGMAARTPRRTFATPFVVTLAAAPACYVQSAPQPQPQPVAQQQAQPADSHPVVISNPPRPQPAPSDPQPAPSEPPPNLSVIHNPPKPQPSSSWHVFKTKDGCEAIVNVQCPAGAACNPPPPSKYDCPPGIAMGKPLTVVTDGNDGCMIEPAPPSCPPNVMCNPPRPTQVACPK